MVYYMQGWSFGIFTTQLEMGEKMRRLAWRVEGMVIGEAGRIGGVESENAGFRLVGCLHTTRSTVPDFLRKSAICDRELAQNSNRWHEREWHTICLRQVTPRGKPH